MKADEYLESVLKESFERELEVDENVARTLPFFAASLAVAVPLYGYVATKIPPLSLSGLSIVLHIWLLGGAGCGAMILWSLFGMVRLREYQIPPREMEQLEWMQALKRHYRGQDLTPATVDKKVTEHLRDRMVLEYAIATEHNRQANAPKLRARAAGVAFLVAMLTIAFLMISTIFIAERLSTPPNRKAADVVAKAEVECAAEARRAAAAPASQVTGPAIGPEVPGRAGGQQGVGPRGIGP